MSVCDGLAMMEAELVNCEQDGGVGGAAGRAGLVILATDQTAEQELSTVLLPLEIGNVFNTI